MGNVFQAVRRSVVKEAKFSVQSFYPVKLADLVRLLTSNGDPSLFDDVKKSQMILFVPVDVGLHWVLVIVDSSQSVTEPVILFWNPKGGAAPQALVGALKSKLNRQTRSLHEQLQFDNVHCGVWCACAATKYVDHRAKGLKPEEFSMGGCGLCVNARSLARRTANTLYIQNERESFRIRLCDALALSQLEYY